MPKGPSLLGHSTAKETLSVCVANGLTDAESAVRLEAATGIRWSMNTIIRARKALGLTKKGDINEKATVQNPVLTAPPINIEGNAKAEWFREQFRKSHLYASLSKQFSDAEVAVYMEEYGHICCQFQDILVSEFFQIDDFLKHRILINRQLISINVNKKEIEQIYQWLDQNPVTDANKEDKNFMKKRGDAYKKLEWLSDTTLKESDRYDKLVAERSRIYTALSATRRDRIDQLKNTGESFFSLVAAISQNDQLRRDEGKFAKLTQLASEEVKDDWRKGKKFPDGQTDAVLLDDKTDFDTLVETAIPATEEADPIIPDASAEAGVDEEDDVSVDDGILEVE